MERIKHFNFKCPICGNNDFVQLKRQENAVNWDVLSETNVYGCTKCHFLLQFSETAVNQILGIEEDRERLFDEIQKNKNELERLETESATLEAKIQRLIEDGAPDSEISNLKDLLENDIKQRIKIFKWDIQSLEDGDEDNGYWPPYSKSYDRFLLCMEEIADLYKRIKEMKEKLEFIK